MHIALDGHIFTMRRLAKPDGLGYDFHWEGQVTSPGLTHWGRGGKQLRDRPLPIALLSTSDDPPSISQQSTFRWLCSHLDAIPSRIQALCEQSWSDCYERDGDTIGEDDEFFVEGIRIPPNRAPEWMAKPRDDSLPSLILVDLDQSWEVEHGFYLVLDPSTPQEDLWTTWDGLAELGLVHEDED